MFGVLLEAEVLFLGGSRLWGDVVSLHVVAVVGRMLDEGVLLVDGCWLLVFGSLGLLVAVKGCCWLMGAGYCFWVSGFTGC